MLVSDPELKVFVDAFFDHYAQAHIKMSEFGQEKNLLSEFDETQPLRQEPKWVDGVLLGIQKDP